MVEGVMEALRLKAAKIVYSTRYALNMQASTKDVLRATG